MERSLLQGLPHPLQIKDFPQPGRALNLSKDQRARSVKTSPEAALLPLLLLSIWSYPGCDALTGLVFTTGPNGSTGVHSLFISQIFLRLIYRIQFASWSQQVEY